jgi:hypothetical protein
MEPEAGVFRMRQGYHDNRTLPTHLFKHAECQSLKFGVGAGFAGRQLDEFFCDRLLSAPDGVLPVGWHCRIPRSPVMGHRHYTIPARGGNEHEFALPNVNPVEAPNAIRLRCDADLDPPLPFRSAIPLQRRSRTRVGEASE